MLRNRIFSGETVMAISFGSENGIPTPLSSPQEFVPIHQMSLQWPMWGQYAETNGNSGQPVDMPQAEKLLELYDQRQLAQWREQKVVAWQQNPDKTGRAHAQHTATNTNLVCHLLLIK